MDFIIYGNDKIIGLIAEYEFYKNIASQDEQEFMNKILSVFAEKDDDIQNNLFKNSDSVTYTNDTAYKLSFYNIHFDNPEGHIIYNTLYNTLVRMSGKEYSDFIGFTDCDLKAEFISNGLWVEEDIDEQERYLYLAKKLSKFQFHGYSITIATTMECNARCPYCYEIGADHSPMESNVETELLLFLAELDLKNGVNITWIGGEPLLNTPLIDNVSDFLTDLGINFSSYIITNGSLITDEIVDKMKTKWNTAGIQVTLDGIGKVYEERKKYVSKKEYFKEILRNINRVGKQGIKVDIRINIERENRDSCINLVEILNYYYADIDKVSYYPAFISGTDDPFTDDEKVDLIGEMFTAGACANKFTVNNKLHSYPEIFPCMICDPYNIAIDNKGYIYKCDHFLGRPGNAVGKINEHKKEFKTIELNLSDECKKCKFLPKCFGGCTSDRNSGERACFISRYLITAYLKKL